MWIEFSILIDSNNFELVSDILLGKGFEGLATDEPIEVIEVPDGYAWKSIRNNKQTIKVYKKVLNSLADLDKNKLLKHEIKCLSNTLSGIFQEIKGDIIPSLNWSEEWKSLHVPISVYEDIIIYPSWFKDSVALEKDEVSIFIEPGLAFGTGEHATTQHCLQLIKKYVKPKSKVLDIGAGSGILSIASSILGASKILAIDIDQNSAHEISKNSQLNNISNIDTLIGDINNVQLLKEAYEIILFNISSEVAISLAPTCLELLEANGLAIVSGIVSWRKKDVLNAYIDLKFKVLEIIEDSTEWITFIARRNA